LATRLEETSGNSSFGLKQDWSEIEQTLIEVIPVYEKVNRYISLGTDLKLRREGISLFLESLAPQYQGSFSVLDLGSGPGKMSEIFSEESRSTGTLLVQFDALMPMMMASRRNTPRAERILGVYENIPLRNGVFDGAMAGFAIRDAINLTLALDEIWNSLKPGGYFVIVDLSKPDSELKKFLIGVYWRTLSPLLAMIASPRLGRRFAALYTTYRRLPSATEFRRLVQKSSFDIVSERYLMLGGSAVILLRKNSKPKS
jgi:demethylmenaquinone methyltransferase / 2-methoxy-6-polyprenyl-1,4-benzoquinol methylase